MFCANESGGEAGAAVVFGLDDGNRSAIEAACASICCFGKSCDGHSKCTQWKIYGKYSKNRLIFLRRN